jgi:hypothetical protein
VLWFHCGFRNGFRQRFEICGPKKFLSIDDLVLPAEEPTNYVLGSSSLMKYDLITCHERESAETEPGPVQVSVEPVRDEFVELHCNISTLTPDT